MLLSPKVNQYFKTSLKKEYHTATTFTMILKWKIPWKVFIVEALFEGFRITLVEQM